MSENVPLLSVLNSEQGATNVMFSDSLLDTQTCQAHCLLQKREREIKSHLLAGLSSIACIYLGLLA